MQTGEEIINKIESDRLKKLKEDHPICETCERIRDCPKSYIMQKQREVIGLKYCSNHSELELKNINTKKEH